MKKRWIHAGAFLLALLLAACSGRGGVIAGQGDGEPGGADQGFYTAGQSVAGGKPAQGANLKDISVWRQGGDTVVTLSFRSGSDEAGTEERNLPAAPAYTLKALDGADRFALQLEGVEYWDYALYEEELADTALRGVFHHGAFGPNQGALYFNLTQPCDFRTEQSGNQLTLYFRPRQPQQGSRWYIAVNGYDLYPGNENLDLLQELTLYPTLCSDLASVILLSKGFADKSQAQQFLTQHEQTISRLLPGRVPSLVELPVGALPENDEQAQLMNLMDTPVGTREGQACQSELLQANGRFLCWAPDGASYIYTRTSYEAAGEGMTGYEQLWQHGQADEPVLEGHEYVSILSAEYSADGRYLAVLEQNEQLYRSLEIVDMNTGLTYLPTEMGFGHDTPAFVWDEERPVLYAISGEGEGLQFMSYDLTTPGSPVSQALHEPEAFESALDEAGGRLYFIQWSQQLDRGQLCSMPVDGGPIRTHTSADSFLLSPNKQYSAVSGDNEQGPYLNLANLSTGQVVPVDKGSIVVDMQWDAASDRLYYSVYNVDAEQESQPLSLYAYDVASGTSEKLMDMVAGSLYPANVSRGVVLVYLFTQVNQAIAMSYWLPLP